MKKLFFMILALQLVILPVPVSHAGGIAGMANQLRGMAIAAVGTTVLTSCKLSAISTSIKIFAAAAVVYLAGEMMAGKSQKGTLEDKSAEMDSSLGGKGGDTQLKALEAQLKDKEEKKKVADKRKMFTAASMALMTAAAVVAVTEIPRQYTIPPTMLPLGCESGSGLVKGKLAAAGIAAGFTFLTGGGMIGSLITGIGMYLIPMSAMINAMNMAEGRATVFGVMAGLTGLALMDATSASSKLAGEIKQLKEVIAQFKKETDGEGKQTEDTSLASGGADSGANSGADGGLLAGTTSGSAGGISSGATAGAITALPNGQTSTTQKTCISNEGFTNDCSKALVIPKVNLAGLGTGPEIQQVASQGIATANDISSGDASGRAEIGAASLASAATKVNDALKKQLAKTNATLRNQGKKQLDFDKEVAAMTKSYNDAVAAQAAKSGQTLASLGLSGDTSLDPNAIKNAQEIAAASASTALAVPTSKGDAQAVDSLIDSSATDASAVPNPAAVSSTEALGNNLDSYESAENDISNKSEESLWKQVSNRYILNYNKFFERKSLPAPAQQK